MLEVPDILLEFERLDPESNHEAMDRFAFCFEPQSYRRTVREGPAQTVRMRWGHELLNALRRLDSDRQQGESDEETLNVVQAAMARFLDESMWFKDHEARILELDAEQRPVRIVFRSSAPELFALPWDLVRLPTSGIGLHELHDCLVRYQWSGARAPVRTRSDPQGGRVLFAWSDAGGALEVEQEIATSLADTCQQAGIPFSREHDLLPNVTLESLGAALSDPQRPVTALHILCHGMPSHEDTHQFGLCLHHQDEGKARRVVSGTELAAALARHTPHLRLVVLQACHSGDVGYPGVTLAGVAQAIHRRGGSAEGRGVEAVISSRWPLRTHVARQFADHLYRGLLLQSASVEHAFVQARQTFSENRGGVRGEFIRATLGLQFYGNRPDWDTRPFVLCPYPGQAPFRQSQHVFFSGRQEAQQELWARIDAIERAEDRPFLHRLVLVWGEVGVVADGLANLPQVGVGKSSLVQAGLLGSPRCQQRFRQRMLGRPSELRGSEGFDLLRSHPPIEDTLLVLDPFDEVFDWSQRERSALWAQIWELATFPANQKVVVVLVARSGVLDRPLSQDIKGPLSLAALVDGGNQVRVPRLDREQMRQAIQQPARQVGLRVAPAVVESLLEHAPPPAMLQIALLQLWQARRGRTLDQRSYTTLGGIEGIITAYQRDKLQGYNPTELQIVRRILADLILIAGGRVLDVGRKMPRDALLAAAPEHESQVEPLLRRLTADHLLSEDAQLVDGSWQTLVEMVHPPLAEDPALFSGLVQDLDDARFLQRWATHLLQPGGHPAPASSIEAMEQLTRDLLYMGQVLQRRSPHLVKTSLPKAMTQASDFLLQQDAARQRLAELGEETQQLQQELDSLTTRSRRLAAGLVACLLLGFAFTLLVALWTRPAPVPAAGGFCPSPGPG